MGKKKEENIQRAFEERDRICEDKQEKSKRQIIEAVNSQIKNFNLIGRWRKVKTFVAYLYAYAIGYSFFRKSKLWR